MKLNDIYKNLNKTLDITNIKQNLLVQKKFDASKNIDSIKNKLNDIKLNKKQNIKISKYRNKSIDSIKTKKLKIINLKNIISNSKKITYKLKILFINIEALLLNVKNSIIPEKFSKSKTKKYHYLAYFLLFCSLIIIDKIIIENLVKSWIHNIYNLKISKNIENIEIQLVKAKTKFNIANILFIPFKVIPEQNLINANNWIQALKDTSWFLLDFIEFYKENYKYIEKKKISDIYFANLLENNKWFFINSEEKINEILKKLNKIKINKSNDLNWDYIKLESLKTTLNSIDNSLNIINNNFDTFLNILWKIEAKKYFIVFQNNDEIRPTWGFMWSAWILEIFAWKIKSFNQKDIYAYEWDVNKNYSESVKPPTWVKLLSERLWLRDANAFIDFSISAKSINYFIQKWWYDIDWIIFINQKIILDILEELWEIDFWKYNTKITSKNFSEVISLLVEAKVSKNATLETPKQVLFDFWELVVKKIINQKKYSTTIKSIIDNIKSRDIVFYSFNKTENKLLQKLNINWYIDFKNNTDFNYPFFISVWWNKSDRYMNRKYKKSVNINKQKDWDMCSLYTEFEIVLNNNFNKEIEDRLKSEMKNFRIKEDTDLLNIAWKWTNKSYTKVLIPKDAVIYKDSFIKNWYIIIDEWEYLSIEKLLETKSWKSNIFKIKYNLENIDCNTQNIKIYKQAWVYKYDLNLNYINLSNNKEEKIKLDWLKQDFNYNSKK